MTEPALDAAPAPLGCPNPCTDLAGSLRRHADGRPDARVARMASAFAQPGAVVSHYQPIIDLGTDEVVAHEALLRVADADGLLPPADLFELAADIGLSQALDQLARRTAIEGAAGWLGENTLFVNFVPSSIYDPAVCLQTTEAAVRRSGISMSQLVFEVVETEKIRDIGHLRSVFARYHEMGARVALDDLGAGHASLEVAAQLEPDVVKLDGDVVRALPTDGEAQAFVADVVALAEEIGATVLAEGVEDATHADAATQAGITLAQGWHYGRPVPRDQTVGPG